MGYVYVINDSEIPKIEAELLKHLGRYYFLINKEFSNNLDSCKKQIIITKFVNEFYPRRKVENEITVIAIDIIILVPNLGANILPEIWFEIIKKIPNTNIAKPKSDSSIDNLFMFHGMCPK